MGERLATLWALVALAAPATAAADPPPLTRRPLTLPRGELRAALHIETSLSDGAVAEPVSLAPDVYVGVFDLWTLGVTHSIASQSLLGAGGGLCVTGTGGGCPEVYDNIGIDSLVQAYTLGPIDLAVRTRLNARTLDPFRLELAIGALMRHGSHRTALVVDPYVAIGLTRRDEDGETAYVIPAWFQIQITAELAAFVRTGVSGPGTTFRDDYVGVLSGGLVYSRAGVDVGVDAGSPALWGGGADRDLRHVVVSVAWQGRLVRREE